MVTDDELANIRRLRGQGWSQQRIADELGLSRQTIGYQLKKLSLDTLSSKPVRVIHTKSVSSGPRVFDLDVNTFERERQNEVVYQIGPDVYELRHGCMHHTRLEGDASGCDYSDWVSLMEKVPDTTILEEYRSTIDRFTKDNIVVHKDWFRLLKIDMLSGDRPLSFGYRAGEGKDRISIPAYTKNYRGSDRKMIVNGNEYPYDTYQYAPKPQTTAFGLQWLEKNGEDFLSFNDIDVNKFLQEVIEERVESIPSMEIKLTGDPLKDIFQLHQRFGSIEGMIDSLTPERVFLVAGPNSSGGLTRFEGKRTKFVSEIVRETLERIKQTKASKTD